MLRWENKFDGKFLFHVGSILDIRGKGAFFGAMFFKKGILFAWNP